MNASRTALVTGANQGLGRALVEGLAARMTPADLVLLTGRDPERVGLAADEVGRLPGTRARVEGRVLDVTDAAAITRLAAELQARHGGVDVVLSNAVARVLPDESQAERADEFIDVSNTATHAVLRAFGPVLRPGGRLLVVASGLGTLGHLDARLHPVRRRGPRPGRAGRRVLARRRPRGHRDPGRLAGVAERALEGGAGRGRPRGRRGAPCAGPRHRDARRGRVPRHGGHGHLAPWFSDYSQAQTPARAAEAVLDLVFTEGADPALYGQLVRFGEVLSWYGGSPLVEQDRMVRP